jgi:predicted AlkP superfamily pyrophosphatase or phosphodiesterase
MATAHARTVVLNVVGLTPDLLFEGGSPQGTPSPAAPNLAGWARRGKLVPVRAVTPAVTCSAQATYLTGRLPGEHGIVGNGWYFRDECEVRFWRQSNRLVQAPKLWDAARAADPSLKCANLFWWYNMYSSADYAVTPRPMYPADGRKLPDVYTHPADLRPELNARLRTFPLFEFWGPRASIRSSQWIADSARFVEERHSPTLSLVYLPHLDYVLQRDGPSSGLAVGAELYRIDALCGELIAFYEGRGVQVVVVSEYGVTDVTTPIHLNRVFRERGLIAVREELGHELLDAGASTAFAVADHQVAHVYVNDLDRIDEVREIVECAPGVEQVLGGEGKRRAGLDHPRAGELVAIARADAWFTYYYWLDDSRAPDYARTVDIHRKPGYDPVELYIDPRIKVPPLTVGLKLMRKALGFRYLMDVIPLDASLVKGSHGRPTDSLTAGPLLATQRTDLVPGDALDATEVFRVLLAHIGVRDATEG